jgi:hypothetical protein
VSWLDEAACRGTLRTEVFYDTDPRIALEVCRVCPSLLACRAEGDATETPGTTFGVLGGETEYMRIQRRAKRGRYRRNPAKAHGTPGGYRAHRDFGEDACEACAAAWRDYTRERERHRPPRSDEYKAAAAERARARRAERRAS